MGEKLWTMYEIAIYLLLGTRARIIFCPPFMTKLVFFLMFTMWITYIVVDMHRINHDNWIVFWLSYAGTVILSNLVTTIACRFWSRKLAFMQVKLQGFCACSATCSDENDRPLVN